MKVYAFRPAFLFGEKMTFKDILLKINTFPADRQADARRAVLQGKMSGLAPDAVWDSIKDFGQETEKKTTKQNTVKASVPASDRVPEVIQGEAVSDEDYINGLYMPEIEKRVNDCLTAFCADVGQDDPNKLTQRQFTAFSIYTGRHIFKGTKLLKSDLIFDNNSAMPTNCAQYDLEKVVAVLNLYVYICTKYSKAFTYDGGEYFCGLSDGFISDHKEKLTGLGFSPAKKAENTIAAGLLDGRINPTGSIAWLNYNAKWAQPSQASAPASVNVSVYPVLSASDAPKLPDSDKM